MARSHSFAADTVILLADEAATESFAAEVARDLEPGDVVALSGDLGAGKTVFARAVIRALATAAGIGVAEVPSPTFTLVQQYELGGRTVYHFDLYRLGDASEAWELGIEDAFADGICLIEWAERIEDLLPRRTVRIELAYGPKENAREARIAAPKGSP